ncbi:Bacterial membrane protein YfhO [Pseudomonas chlororaphis]|uniref:hypothetical protein n=1 Tax=Pseudomonas chlororaphis TaxID=587753 RepID=UPI0039E29AD0
MKEKNYYLIVALVIATNIFIALQYVSISPLVDGWAVWNRVMLLNFNEFSFVDYLLMFFGAHPHSIVMMLAWIDYHLSNANQITLAVAAYIAIAAFALFCTQRYLIWAKKVEVPRYAIILGGVAIALLATTLADQQVMTIPFQAVLAISRLSYIVLLWALIRSLRDGSALNLLIVTLLSCLAVTFHGSGPIFSLLFITVHCMMYKGFWRFLTALGPLAATMLHSYFYKSGGELNSITSLISWGGFTSVLKSIFAYFASLLFPLHGFLNENILLLIGAVVFLFVVCLACYCILTLISDRFKKREISNTDDEKLFAGILSLFILLSGLAAAILMTIRVGPDSYKATLATPRYVAYSLLAYALAVCVLVRSLKGKDIRNTLKTSLVILIGIVGIYPTFTFKSDYQYDNDLNKAIAAISVGISPLTAPADGIWPSAKEDWYWVNALPQTVTYLKEEKLGPWSMLPSLHQFYMGKQKPKLITISSNSKFSTNCNGNVFQFSGTLPAPQHNRFFRNEIITIIDAANKIIGFATQIDSQRRSDGVNIQGYIVSTTALPTEQIYAGPTGDFYISKDKVDLLTTYNLTDQNFLKGVARSWPGFFVEDTAENRNMLTLGSILKLSDGSYRTITDPIIANGFLNIYLSGATLDGEAVGYPKPIKVIKTTCK